MLEKRGETKEPKEANQVQDKERIQESMTALLLSLHHSLKCLQINGNQYYKYGDFSIRSTVHIQFEMNYKNYHKNHRLTLKNTDLNMRSSRIET